MTKPNIEQLNEPTGVPWQALEAERRLAELDDVYKLASEYSQVERSTRMPDGSYEKDAHHVVTLQLVSMALATKYYPDLDVGKIAICAALHDIVEAEVDDESTFGATPNSLALKHKREEEGLKAVCKRLGTFGVLAVMVMEIENIDTVPEYAFVKSVDKLMPGFTHQANGATGLINDYGVNNEVDFWAGVAATDAKLKTYCHQFPELYEMRQATHRRVLSLLKQQWETA